MANTNTTNETAPVDPTLAPGAAEAATTPVQETGLEGGMKVITTPQGKASVDKNAPGFVEGAFDDAAQAAGDGAPQFDPSGKRIVGNTGLRDTPNALKGKSVVVHSMITTKGGKHFVSGQGVGREDLGEEFDTFTERGAIAPYKG